MLWSLISSFHKRTITVRVPLCIYNENAENFCAPELVTITLQGSKTDLQAIDYTSLALHIDGKKIKNTTQKPHHLILTAKDLLLPQQIAVLRHNPLNLGLTRELL